MKNSVSKIDFKKIGSIAVIMLMSVTMLFAQNRGNALGFQGLDEISFTAPRVAALGGSFSAVSGDINTLSINPAGLSGLEGLSITLNSNMYMRSWYENQEYRPNRRFVTLPFYLEGLYVPDPANNGMWDHEVFAAALLDTSYNVNLPDTGLYAYSEEAAGYVAKKNGLGNIDLKVALPLEIGERTLTLALGVKALEAIEDRDNNASYLDPHLAYTEYDMIEQLDGTDTVRMNWYDFTRTRSGVSNSFTFGAGMDILSWLSAGFSVEYMSASSNDYQMKSKIGYFDLFDDNEFMYSYDTLDVSFAGTSNFSAFKSKLGLQLDHEHVSMGFSLKLPYMLKRNYEYEKSVMDTLGTTVSTIIGAESVKIPMGFQLGFLFKPIESLKVSIDIAQTPYENSVWVRTDDREEIQRDWVNQEILAFGLEYKVIDALALRAGYRSESQVFVPDGADIRTKGPEKICWSAGIGLDLGKVGSLDLAYVFSDLKYYDQYFSNINYVHDMTHRFVLGYSITL